MQSAENLIASLYGKNRAVPEPRKLNDNTFVDTLPINKPTISTSNTNSVYDKLIKDPAKRQTKALAKIDKESLMDEIQTLRKQRTRLRSSRVSSRQEFPASRSF